MKKVLFFAIMILSAKFSFADKYVAGFDKGTDPVNSTYWYVTNLDAGTTHYVKCTVPGPNCCQFSNGVGPLAGEVWGSLIIGGHNINYTGALLIAVQNLANDVPVGRVDGDNGIGYFSWQDAQDGWHFTYDEGQNN